MQKILIVLVCIVAAVLLWIIVPEEESHIDMIDCGNSMQLVKNTYSFYGREEIRYGLYKNGIDILAPIHRMVENEHLKLRVFYGPNANIHIYDMETGEKIVTGRVYGFETEDIWFCPDDNRQCDGYLLVARYKASSSPVEIKTDTIAAFDVKNGKTCLVKMY